MDTLIASFIYPLCKVKRRTFQDAHDRWLKNGKWKHTLMATDNEDNKKDDNTAEAKF